MKPVTTALFALILLFAISACKKNNPQSQPIVYPNYSELKVGNYWVYQEYNIDTFGNATALNYFDSCYVVKDTVINTKTYMVLAGPQPIAGATNTTYQYLRDSLDFIVDNMGDIIFSSQHSGFTFRTQITPYDTFNVEMAPTPVAVTVPAGSYSTLDCIETIKALPQYAPFQNPRYCHTRYAQNIGIITLTLEFYADDPNYTERRLVRYHLN
jgi:hypothetical protein